MSKFEAIVKQHGREFYLTNKSTVKKKGIFSPYFYSMKDYKPLTPYEKLFFRLQVLPNVQIFPTSIITLDGDEYEVRSVQEYRANNTTLYKTAILRRLEERK